MQTVVRSLKYDRRPHIEWPAEILVQNDEMIMCLARPGTVCVHHSRGTHIPFERTLLGLFVKEALFNTLITFNSEGRLVRTYCNIALPPEFGDGALEWVDLDLDVILHPGSDPLLEDEDEFAEHQIRYGYPPDLVQRVESTARDLLARAHRGDPPFLNLSLEQVIQYYGAVGRT